MAIIHVLIFACFHFTFRLHLQMAFSEPMFNCRRKHQQILNFSNSLLIFNKFAWMNVLGVFLVCVGWKSVQTVLRLEFLRKSKGKIVCWISACFCKIVKNFTLNFVWILASFIDFLKALLLIKAEYSSIWKKLWAILRLDLLQYTKIYFKWNKKSKI